MKFIFGLLFIIIVSTISDAQIREEVNYYPLSVGNVWQYKVHTKGNFFEGDTTYYLKRTVVSDSIMQNGKKYFKVVPIQPDPSYIFSNYIRIDSATANVYYYNTFANYEGIIDTLAAQPGDSYSVVFSAGNPASPHQFSVVCLQIDTVNLFNTLTDVKKFYIPIVDNKRWYNYAKGIGNIYNKVSIVWIIGYDLIYDLVYAKINGKEYGTFVGVKGNDMIPGSYSLSQNYPNPFNPITKIRYSLPAAGFVSLKVYDLVGQEIHMLVNEEKPAGSFEVSFDGKNLASGVYFYKLSSGSFTQTKKFILMR